MASRVVSKLAKPPVNVFGVEGRYVNALYSAAFKTKQLDAIESDLAKLTGLFKTDTKFRDYLVNPLISPAQKGKVIDQDLKPKLKLSDLSVKLLSAMAENGRLKSLPAVNDAYSRIMSAVRNELPVTITSAKPLDQAKKQELEASLKAFSSKKLIISYNTDSSIVGGLVIDFNGEHYIDMSLKSKIKLYSDLLRQAV
ncbi:ATP synthase subunit O, mitochondrial, partial [Fragariocoptes setiger]